MSPASLIRPVLVGLIAGERLCLAETVVVAGQGFESVTCEPLMSMTCQRPASWRATKISCHVPPMRKVRWITPESVEVGRERKWLWFPRH